MKPADAGDEKLGTDALCGDELADEDLEGVTGGSGTMMVFNVVPQGSGAKEVGATGPPPGILL